MMENTGTRPEGVLAGPKVVALGGGHGLAASLAALRLVSGRLTAVVTVADVKNLVAAEEARGVGRAVRTMLASPLVTYTAVPDSFELVLRHRSQVAQWFSYFCGWNLDVDARSGSIRLYKLVEPDDRHPLRRPRGSGDPFDRRRYAVLCLAAAELLGSPVVLLTELAETIADMCAEDPGLPEYRLNHGPHRSELVDAVLFLGRLGGVHVVDGSAESWGSDRSHAVLLRARPAVLMSFLASPQPPSRVESRDIATLTADPRHQIEREDVGEAGRGRYSVILRQRIMRRLADTAVVHFDEMQPDEVEYARTLTGSRQIATAAAQAGMVCEWRREGIMWVDPDRIATDQTFPDSGGNTKQAALLLLDFLQERGSATDFELEGEIHRLLDLHPKWAKDYRAVGGVARMATEAMWILGDFGLVRRDGVLVELRPAARRYRVTQTPTTAKDRP
jgi:uncharacterized protein (TIGR02678 family)